MKTSQASSMAILERPNPYSSSSSIKTTQEKENHGLRNSCSWEVSVASPGAWQDEIPAPAPGFGEQPLAWDEAGRSTRLGSGRSWEFQEFFQLQSPRKTWSWWVCASSAAQKNQIIFCLAWLWGWMLAILIPPCSREQKIPCKIHSESEPHLKELLILLLGTNPKNIPGGKPGSKWMCCSGRRKSCFKGNI